MPWQCDMCPRSGLAQQARERDRRRGPAGKGDSLEAFNPYSHFYMQSKAEATTKFFSFILFSHRFSLLFIFSITLALNQLEFHIHIFPLRFCCFGCEFCHAFDLGFPRYLRIVGYLSGRSNKSHWLPPKPSAHSHMPKQYFGYGFNYYRCVLCCCCWPF